MKYQVSIIVWFSENPEKLIIMKIILSTVYVNNFLNFSGFCVKFSDFQQQCKLGSYLLITIKIFCSESFEPS